MKIDKIVLIGIIALVFSISVVYAAFDTSTPWHPLQRIGNNVNPTTSVDAGGNNVIDNSDFSTNADLLDYKNSNEFCWSTGENCRPDQDTRCDTSGTCNQVCIGVNCRSTWPVDTDTRCDTSGTCNQVCIGADCKTAWPSGGSGGVTSLNGLTGAVTLTHTGGLIDSITTPGGNVIRINADTTFSQNLVTSGNIYVQANAPSGWLHARRANSSSYVLFGADHLVSYGDSGAFVFNTRDNAGSDDDGFYWRKYNNLNTFNSIYNNIMRLTNEGNLTLTGNLTLSNGRVFATLPDAAGTDSFVLTGGGDFLTMAGNIKSWNGNDVKLYSDSGATQTVHIDGSSGDSWFYGGNFGIGTKNPTQKLDVVGQIKATGDICTAAGGGKCLGSQATCFWEQSSNRIYYWDGNVGIGTNNPTEALDVVGNAQISGDTYVYGTAYSGGSSDGKKVCTKDGTNCPMGLAPKYFDSSEFGPISITGGGSYYVDFHDRFSQIPSVIVYYNSPSGWSTYGYGGFTGTVGYYLEELTVDGAYIKNTWTTSKNFRLIAIGE